MKSQKWEDKLKDFCNRCNLEVKYLAEILNDPKVVPMTSDKSFEFTVQKHLSEILLEKYQNL